MVRFFPAIVALLAALPLPAAYSGRDLFVPIAGRGIGHDGRAFSTSLWLTNLSGRDPVDVRIAFLQSGHANPSPRTTAMRLGPSETRAFEDLGAGIFGAESAIGALRIEASSDVVAHTHINIRGPADPIAATVPTAFNAIPARFAAGKGQSSIIQGFSTGTSPLLHYKLYLVETTGQPVYLDLDVVDEKGREAADHKLFLAGFEARTIEAREEFPSLNISSGLIRISGVNGSGRVIMAGSQVSTVTQYGTADEMSLVATPRSPLPLTELIAYSVIGAVIVIVLLKRRSG
ncbi:MAG TPA: hypothetical protein VEZ11_13530 [Thermoanaerobaculia bacterium]|nr:hypothetical protein [Thermoanaerobaculia bacterium]